MFGGWHVQARRRPLLLAAVALLGVLAACATGRGAAGGWSGVADGGDVVYVGSMEGQLLALDSDAGVRVGAFPLERDAEVFNAIYGTPAIANGRIYVAGFNGNVYSLDRDTLQPTGAVFQVEGDSLSKAVAGAVVAADDRVAVAAAEGAQSGRLYVLDAMSLREVCRFPAEGAIGRVWSTPAVAEGVAYFGDLAHRMYAVSLEDCSSHWAEPTELEGGIGSTPLVLNGKVYVGTFNRKFYAIDAATGEAEVLFEGGGWFWSGTTTDGRRLFVPNLDGKLYAVDPTSGTVAWEFDTEGAILSTPVVVDDRVVVGSDAEALYVLDTALGNKLWEYPVDGQVRAPLMAKQNVVYVNTMAHTVDAVDIETGRALWRQPFNTKE